MKLKIKVVLFLFVFILVLSSFKRKKTLTVYNLNYDKERFHEPKIPISNPMTVEGVSLGRLLFYDSILSKNNKQSCGSCHKQQFSFSDGGKKYSMGVNGKEGNRNTMTLVNLAWQTSFFWDGRARELEDVIHFPIMDSLEMAIDTNEVVRKVNLHTNYPILFKKVFNTNKVTFYDISRAIAQFLRTLNISGYNPTFFSFFNKFKENESPVLLKEESLAGMYYRTVNTCGRCHPGEGVGDTKFANNLITTNEFNSRFKITQDSLDISSFKVPSLINIMFSAPYMHDGRFKTIDEVIEHYDDHIKEIAKNNPNKFEYVDIEELKLTEYDKKNFKLFFNTFTDSTLLTSKKFSNPFYSKKFTWKDFPYFK